MRRQDPSPSQSAGMDPNVGGDNDFTSIAAAAYTADITVLPSAESSVQERLARLDAAQMATVRAAFGEEDLDRLDPDEVIDMCDRVSEYITFSQYQARSRARRGRAKRS